MSCMPIFSSVDYLMEFLLFGPKITKTGSPGKAGAPTDILSSGRRHQLDQPCVEKAETRSSSYREIFEKIRVNRSKNVGFARFQRNSKLHINNWN